ncbi:hypothetical protein KP509_27G020200 [Ceratopteris richardii]|nr:hypothetical protein KP509_27G020200 [Ceratopteris richardii]
MGRQFYRCPLNQGEGSCGFFKWCDEALPASSATPAYGGSPFKERAPISNVTTGQCYKCGKDGHWAKDCSFTAQNTPPKGFPITAQSIPASGTTGSCFKCGQEGHWARDCQNQQSGLLSKASAGFDRHRTDANSSTGLPNVGGFGNAGAIHQTTGAFGTMNSDTCFKCGSQGHWSKDCPAMRSGSYGGVQSQGLYSGRSTGSSKSCFKCGGQGHWANECRPYGKG